MALLQESVFVFQAACGGDEPAFPVKDVTVQGPVHLMDIPALARQGNPRLDDFAQDLRLDPVHDDPHELMGLLVRERG